MLQKNTIYYNCTGNNGKCKPVYVREDVIDKQVDEAIRAIMIDDEFADYLNQLLDENYKELQVFTKEKADYMDREITKIKTRKDKLFDAYLDGNFSKEEWAEKNLQFELRIKELEEQIKLNKLRDDKFINEGKKILELAKDLHNSYLSQDMYEKKRMLKLIFSNLTLDGENLHYTYKEPFCYFAKMAHSNKKLPEKCQTRKICLDLYSAIINTPIDFFYKLQGFKECA